MPNFNNLNSEKKPSLTIGIVSYNSLAYLPECLDAIQDLEGVKARIVIVDNASKDGSRDWLKEQKEIDQLILSEDNLGFAKAHNLILSDLSTDFYLALNPDVVLDTAYAAKAIVALTSNESYGWATGKVMVHPQQEISPKTIYSVGHALLRDGFAFNIGHGMTDAGQFDRGREVFGANGAAALYRRDFLEDARFPSGEVFDELMFLYYEDVDLDWRGQLLGWRCRYEPEARAWHVGDYTGAGQDLTLQIQGLANRYRSVLKNAFPRDLLLTNLPIYAAHSLLKLTTRPRSGSHMVKPLAPKEFTGLMQKRRWIAEKRRIDRPRMQAWFLWAEAQPGAESGRIFPRLRSAL